MTEPNYLKVELDQLIQNDPATWEFLQRGSLDGCWYWDLEHPDNEWMSPEFWQLFGIDPAKRRHDPAEWQDIIFPEDRDLALANFERHLADPDYPYDQIVRYRHADGSTVWVRCRGVAIRDDNGKPVRMLGAHNDLTAVKEAERALRAEKRLVEQTNQELREFAYSVSHDLKSPSNTLRLLFDELDHLNQAAGSDESRSIIALGHRTIDRMQDIINAVVHYTEVIGGARDDEVVDLEPLMADVCADLEADRRAAAGRFQVERLGRVRGDPLGLRRLFQNLMANGLKFRREDVAPRIRVACASEDDMLRIDVQDNGIGIEPANHERIFRVFQRLHLHEEFAGAGLGLAICRRIAADHGGSVDLSSVPGEGSVFHVRLKKA